MNQRCTREARPGSITISLLVGALMAGAAAPTLADNGELQEMKQVLEQQQKQIQRLETLVGSQSGKPADAAGPKPIRMYGVLDSGLEHLTNIGAAGKSLTRVPAITGTVASRLGFQADKEIAPGYKAIATLEMGFNTDNGALGQSNRIFGRQLFGGLATPYGSFTLGRQYSMLIFGMSDSDILGPNIYSLGSLDVYLPNARTDNALAWRGKFGNFSLGAQAGLGRDTLGGAPGTGTCAGEVAGSSKSCQAWSTMLKYDTDWFGVDVATDEQRGGTGATTSFFNGAATIPFASASDKDRRVHAGGYVKFGSAKLGAGWLGRKVATAAGEVESDTYYLLGSYNFSPAVSVDGGFHQISNDVQNRDAKLIVARAFYHFDKDLAVYGQVGNMQNSDQAQYALSVGAGVAPAAGGSQSGYMLGARYRF